MSQPSVSFNQNTTAGGFIENINALQNKVGMVKIVIDGEELSDDIMAAGVDIARFYNKMPLRFQVDVACGMNYENYLWRAPIEKAVSSVFRDQKLWKS